MKKQQTKNRASLTLAELLQANFIDPALLPTGEKSVPNLPIAVTDWITKYVAGETVPFGDMFHPDDYATVEMVVAILLDKGGVTGDMLPDSAIGYVEEWLYRLEEETDLHVWNDAQVARVFLTIVLQMARESDSTDGHIESLQTALSRLCTEKELDRFYGRYGLKPKASLTKVSQHYRDRCVASNAARVLANPAIDGETKKAISEAIFQLSTASDVTVDHPALAERALNLMFESKEYVTGKASVQQSRKRLRELVNAVPYGEHTHKPASLKK